MKKIRLVNTLLVILLFVQVVSVYTVRADETQQVGSGIGPGYGPGFASEQSEPSLENVKIEGDIRNLEVTNPIVPTLEKYSYDQMVQDIQNLSNRYGNLMKANIIGISADGRDIYEIVVGNQDASRHILIQAGIHGREYMTPMLVMKQIELALSGYYRGSYNERPIAEMFDQAAIHFVPMSNPDGTALSQFGLDGIRSEELCFVINSTFPSWKPLLKQRIQEILRLMMILDMKNAPIFDIIRARIITIPNVERCTLLPENHVNNILDSVMVETKTGIKVTLVFVRNRNKKMSGSPY